LSGGEPADHPAVIPSIQAARERGFTPVLLTNGLWLGDDRRDAILSTGILVQVTNDPRLYPQRPPRVRHPSVTYVDALSVTVPLGRFAGKTLSGVPERRSPTCFNLRSATRSCGDVRTALAFLRMRSMSALSGACIPSICAAGTVVAGESRFCRPIGTVDSTPEELTRELAEMTCDRCGLSTRLTLEERRAINESALYGPGE